MTAKLLEIRDRGTCIPALAIHVSGQDGPIMRHAGFGSPMVYLVLLSTQQCRYDPYGWSGVGRTMKVAHIYIESSWREIHDGDVIDVEYLLGETSAKKSSDIEARVR